MSESERRREYHHNRILIETARILSPSFDDAVVFLSGAQIEMLRNVSQYLNRQETYVTEYNPGYYLMPTVADYDDILEIVADLEETLMGNPNTLWGYKDRWHQQVVETSVAGENVECITTPVPAGYVYILEHVYCYHNNGSTRNVELYVDVQTGTMQLYIAPALPSNDRVILPTHFTLKEGDTVNWLITALGATKHALLRVTGYMMVVPE